MIFKKLMSIAITTAVILGCGATINAASSDYNIDETFPDQALNEFVRKHFDLNSDGYLDSSEISEAGYKQKSGERSLTILSYDDEIECLDGLEIFTSCSSLHLYGGKMKKLDLTNLPFESVQVESLPDLKTFVCGKNQTFVYINNCPELKNTFFNYAYNLKKLYIFSCPALTGSIYLDNCSNMTDFSAHDSGISEIVFNENAEIFSLWVINCPLAFLDMRGPRMLYEFIIQTNGKAETSMTVGSRMLDFLWNMRRPDGRGFEYNSDGAIWPEVVLDIYYGSMEDLDHVYI